MKDINGLLELQLQDITSMAKKRSKKGYKSFSFDIIGMFQCKVHLDNETAAYNTDSHITGLFKCLCKRDLRIRTIKIRLDCIEFVKSRFVNITKHDNYNMVFSIEQIVYTATKGIRTFCHGEAVYPFKIFIPRDLPSSFEHSYGKVFYVVTGTVVPFIWNDFKDSCLITVTSPIELLGVRKSFQNEETYYKEESFKYCFNQGRLIMQVRLPRAAFVPGDIVDLMVFVRNQSNAHVKHLKMKFSKHVNFKSENPKSKTMRYVENIMKFKKGGIKAHKEHTYNFRLNFPEYLDVPNLVGCRLIQFKFILKIWCEMPLGIANVALEIVPEMGHCFSGMDQELDKSQHILPLDQPIVTLEVTSAFKGLTEQEKLYSHYISEASWTGGLVTFLQTSLESGPIFVLLHKLFSIQSPRNFKETSLKAGFTEDEVKAFFIYTCGVFSNAGNYKGFGDSKFIPSITADRLEQLLEASPVWPEIKPLWIKLKEPIYDLGPGKTCLGYAPHGCTTYLSSNCTPEDNQRAQDWMKSQYIEGYNTRLFKQILAEGKIDYEIRLASKEKGELKRETFGNMTFRLTKGDYSPLIGRVADSLEKAAKYAANPTQNSMLLSYAQSFITGSIMYHKEGSRFWIKDKGPAVETYIGFIETYRDPAGVRGEFEGFVAVVNRAMSAKFSDLVSHAEEFLPLLPWPKGFEKDKFLRPDFTSLDVLTFASSGIPAGINIPNYDDIRQSEGFKNVSLGNVIPASYQMSVTPFLNESDAQLIQKWRVASFELQVGLHELLGHGSGKLLQRAADGVLNYPDALVDPLTGKHPASCYEPGDSYDARFGPMSSSYEECRAEAVGLYLSLEPSVLKIFGHEGQQAEDVLYVNWLSLVWNGIGRALETWDPKRGWLQAHAQARFVLARVVIQAGVATVTQPRENDLLLTLDRSALKGAGRSAIAHFLLQLQIYKATANVEAAQQLYQHYSEVTEPWISWRAIVLANKQPRKIFTQANTFLKGSTVGLKTYEESPEGMIESWVDRFPDAEPIYQAILELSASDEQHFK